MLSSVTTTTTTVTVLLLAATLLVGVSEAATPVFSHLQHQLHATSPLLMEESTSATSWFDDVLDAVKTTIKDDFKAIVDAARAKFDADAKAKYPDLATLKVDSTASSFSKLCKIPSVASVITTKTDAIEINTYINGGYTHLARCFQSIATGNAATTEADLGKSTPVWYAIAPFASGVVGRSELSAQFSKQAAHDMVGRLTDLVSSVKNIPKLWAYLNNKGDTTLVKDVLSILGAMVVGFSDSTQALEDPKVIIHMLKYFIKAITPTSCKSFSCCNSDMIPGPSIASFKNAGAQLQKCVAAVKKAVVAADQVPDDLRDYLKDGNLRIYGDIGLTGEEYLQAREKLKKKKTVTKKDVFDGFCATKLNEKKKLCSDIYDFITTTGIDANTKEADLKTKFFPDGDSTKFQMAMKIAAFAAIEEAGNDKTKRESLIAAANNALAYIEQNYAVVHAFVGDDSDHQHRVELFTMTTPLVNLKFKTFGWKFYVDSKESALTSNWGEFAVRWPPILRSFAAAYQKKGEIFPLPTSFFAATALS